MDPWTFVAIAIILIIGSLLVDPSDDDLIILDELDDLEEDDL